MKPLVKYFFFLPTLCLLLIACKIDQGLGTLDSSITGKVIFLHPEKRPDYVEAVRVIAAVKLPPESLGDVVFTYTSLDLSREEVEYRIPAPITSYELVAAVWKEKGKTWNYANILGFYGYDPVNYKFEYEKVVLTKEHPVAKDIDIYCDWSLLRP